MKKFHLSRKHVQSFFSRIDFPLRLLLIPSILVGIILIIGIIDLRLHLSMNQQKLHPMPLSYTIHDYPSLIENIDPVITAQSASILDVNSGVFLYEKNPLFHFSMASTTKIMTALVALDYYKLHSVLTVQRDYVEGSGLHLYKGEKFYFSDLLYAMFLPSANDAAYAVADNYPGGINAFVRAMNTKATELHLLSTKYTDPAGLEDDGDFTTVTDLAHLGSIVLQNKTIRAIVNTKYKYITTINDTNQYQLTNLNQLLGLDGVIGIKTGTTEGAGQVLVTAKQNGQHMYVIVVMESEDRYADTWTLLNLLDTDVIFATPLAMVGP